MFDKMLVEHANETRNDGKLHFSSGLQHDRHSVLGYVHGYPHVDRHWGDVAQLITGTSIHEYLHQMFAKDLRLQIYKSELPVSDIIINDMAWTGTADAFIIDSEGQSWLVDYKTTSSNTFEYLRGTPKPEHIMQVSAYYHFLTDGNGDDLPEGTKCGIMYVPVSPTFSRKWAEPTFMEFDPLPVGDVIRVMERVTDRIIDYKLGEPLPDAPTGDWVWKFDKRAKKWKFTYKPHWSARFCPWAPLLDDPCGCSTQEPVNGGSWNPETNEYDLTSEGKKYVDSVTKPWELDNSEKV